MKKTLTARSGKLRTIMLLAVYTAIINLAVSLTWAQGNEGKTFLVHAKTSLKLDDAQICAVPNVAWSARESRSLAAHVRQGSPAGRGVLRFDRKELMAVAQPIFVTR